MPEDTLREHLAAIEGEAPSPAFLASLAARIEEEAIGAAETDLPVYLADPVADPVSPARPTAVLPPGGPRRTTHAAIAAAAVLVILWLVVPDRGDDGSQLATEGAPSAYTASVLPSAIIREGDGDVVMGGPPTAGLDLVLAPWYSDERSALEDLGFVAGLAVPFDLDLPGADHLCAELLRDPARDAVVDAGDLPCGGLSAALVFPDAASAARALAVFAAHFEAHAGAIHQVGLPLERTLELEANLGDGADAFVLETTFALQTFITSQEVAQVVVVTWHTDNLVQLVWDIQVRNTPGGVEAVMAAAQTIDNRTAGERPAPGETADG